jgi:hypothetical protein
MKKLFLLALTIGSYALTFAQTEPQTQPQQPPAKKDWSKVNLSNRPGDHFVIQLGHEGWTGKPDSIKTKGLSRTLNVYFMIDFPFKTDPRFSVAIGAGVSGSSMYFDKTRVEVAGPGTRLAFRNVADTNYFKKYKLALTYLEAPLELRFSNNPEKPGGSLKFAIGGKIGTLVNAHTKGKNLLAKSGGTLNAYTVKENSKRFFNSTRISGTARVGYGNFSLFGSYQITPLLKDGAGPDMHPFSIGLMISGL